MVRINRLVILNNRYVVSLEKTKFTIRKWVLKPPLKHIVFWLLLILPLIIDYLYCEYSPTFASCIHLLSLAVYIISNPVVVPTPQNPFEVTGSRALPECNILQNVNISTIAPCIIIPLSRSLGIIAIQIRIPKLN